MHFGCGRPGSLSGSLHQEFCVEDSVFVLDEGAPPEQRLQTSLHKLHPSRKELGSPIPSVPRFPRYPNE